MNDDASAPAFDLRAVGTGALWGVGFMLLGSVAQGVLGFSSPLSPTTEHIMAVVWQIVGSFVAGLIAARRAAGTGWLHGALAGTAVILVTTVWMGVATALPNVGILIKTLSVGTGAGMVGGITGVNLSSK